MTNIPEYFNYARDIIDQRVAITPNKLAMLWVNETGTEKRLSFKDLAELSNQAANLLIKYGIKKGDRIFLMLPRIPEWWIFSLAMIKVGAIQCPSPTLLTAEDVKQRIKAGNFKMAITDLENSEKFNDISSSCPNMTDKVLVDADRSEWISYLNEVKSDVKLSKGHINLPQPIKTLFSDPMMIMFTSGTSKHPKMVLHSHSYPLGHRITAELWQQLKADDLHYTIADTGWGKNVWGNYFGQWIVGCAVFIYDFRGKFHAEDLLPLFGKYEITSFCAPPTVYRMLVLSNLESFDFKKLRHCFSAGEPLHSETQIAWEQNTGIPILQGYGQTETVCMIANFKNVTPRSGSMGKASPDWSIEIHSNSGDKVSPGTKGRIAVNLKEQTPPGLFIEYLNNSTANREVFKNGFYYTGDRASQDIDGYFWFEGRNDDIIKSSGYRIGPSEVEEVMMQHPAIQEVGVVGAPDKIRGARVKAYVVLNNNYTPCQRLTKELQDHCKRLTAPCTPVK